MSAATLVLSLAAPAVADDTLDTAVPAQGSIPGSSSFFAMRQMAQTFTPRLTGQLDHIALWEGSGNGTAQNFQLQVWTVDTTKTALTPVPGNIPTYQLRGDVNRTQHGWDLVPSVPIFAGREYALVVSVNVVAFRWYYIANSPSLPGYGGGDLWIGSPLTKDTLRDFTFEIYVAGATPPPSPPSNTAPTLNPPAQRAQTFAEGTVPSVSGTWSDPDTADNVSITAAPGSVTQAGPNSQGTWTWTGTAADEDVPVQTVTITANDHHNPAVTTTFTVGFYAVKPTATITPAASTASLLAAASRPKEGQLLSFTGSAHSQSAADNSGPWTYSWSVTKDGAPYPGSGSSTAFSFTPGDEGVYVVTLTVQDDGPLSGTDKLTITVDDVLPTATITGFTPALTAPKIVLPYELVSFAGTFTDPGTDDTHTAAWDFGDKTPVVAGWNVTHFFTTPGVYTVTLEVAQGDDPGVGTATTTVQVLNASDALGAIGDYVKNNLPGLNAGQKNSLIAKLNAAAAAAGRGDSNTATNQLNAFLNELAADEKSGKVSSAEADNLRDDIRAVKAALGGYNRFLDLWPLGI
ncbi:MAG: PKD domain-containing protein [Chloroflexi bacterium]|nr:MAG: PKD domain-containing protein [Chloroflexota bacterium]